MAESVNSIEGRDPTQSNFHWNFTVNALDIAFYTFAMNMISQSTILPLLVSQLTHSKIAVGVIPAIFSIGFLLPQLFTASYAEGLRRKKPFIVFWSALGERLPYLVIGLFLLFFAKSTPTVTLIAIYVLLLVAAGTGGALMPAWYDMIAKVIPLHRRGIWMGVGSGVGAFMGIAGAALAGYFLTSYTFPLSFALCFMVAFASHALSWGSLALNREPDSETVKSHPSLAHYFKQLPSVLRRDHNYQVFLITRSVINLGTMATGFFIVYGSERFHLSGVEVGGLTAVLVGTQAVMNLLLGALGDRRGHKLVLVLGAFAMALASLVAALSTTLVQTPAALWMIFILLGTALAADSVSSFTIIVEFCAPEDRPTYIGLTNTLLAPVKTLAPIFGGWLAATMGYPVMFVIALSVSIAGALLLAGWLKEPRKVLIEKIQQ